MTRYTCGSCKTELETEDSLSGKEEACPVCTKVNRVPPSKHELKAQETVKRNQRRQVGQLKRESEAANKQEAVKQEVVEQELVEQERRREEAVRYKRRQKITQEQNEGPVGESGVEGFLRVAGVMSLIVGGTGVLICVAAAGTDEEMSSLYALAPLLAGVLGAAHCWAVQLGLQYLRRIMNAVKVKKE